MTSEDKKVITYKLVKYTVGVVMFVATPITYVTSLEGRLDNMEKKSAWIEEHFNEEEVVYHWFEKRINDNDVKWAEIKSSLEWIKTMQQDILSRLSR